MNNNMNIDMNIEDTIQLYFAGIINRREARQMIGADVFGEGTAEPGYYAPVKYLVALVNAGILERNEARQGIGMEPIDEEKRRSEFAEAIKCMASSNSAPAIIPNDPPVFTLNAPSLFRGF